MILQRNLVFVRHAQSIGNVMTQDERATHELPNHKFPLTPLGRKQAEITGEYLRELGTERFRAFFHSSYLRTHETMDILLHTMGLTKAKPLCDPRLDEKWDGIFHELTKKELEERYPDQIRLRKRSGYYNYRAPGGQNGPDVELQIRSFLGDYFRSYEAGDVLICGHGRWFLFFQKVVHDLTVEQLLELKRQEACENCSVTIYKVFDPPKGLPETVCPWKGKIEEVQTECA